MKFDTVIIGGGLAALISGIRLAQQKQKCVIISSGQSALHFFSGSFDLLKSLPDGTKVEEPYSSYQELIKQAPFHPYAKFQQYGFEKIVEKAEEFLREIGLSLKGSGNKNHYRITPMGELKPTWLSVNNFVVSKTNQGFPWKKAAIFNIEGFLDFYHLYIEKSLSELGIESFSYLFTFDELDKLRRNPSEFRSVNISRVLNQNLDKLANILKENNRDSEIIILPAFLGDEKSEIIEELSTKVGKPIRMIATLPPSFIGIEIQQYLREYFRKLGGVYMLGDHVIGGEIENGKINKIYTENHGNIPFVPDHVILASGSFFSQGLVAYPDKIIEPVFNLETEYIKDRNQWYEKNLFDSQNYMKFGVKTDKYFKGILQDKTIDNLYVSGAILSGFNPIKEGCGAGVSILSALYIAEQILTKVQSYESITK